MQLLPKSFLKNTTKNPNTFNCFPRECWSSISCLHVWMHFCFPKDQSGLQAYLDSFPKGIARTFMAACLSACLTACVTPLEIPKHAVRHAAYILPKSFWKNTRKMLMHSNAFLESVGAVFHGCMFGCMSESTGNPETCSQTCSLHDSKIFPKDKSKLQAYPDPFPKGIAAPFMAACFSACLTACSNPLEIPKRSQTCSLYCAEIRCKKRKHKSYYIQMLS